MPRRRGVQIVQQELTLIPTLSIAENLFLHRLPARWGMVRFGLLRTQARRALAAVGLEHLDPAAPTGGLGVGEQQLVEIARALTRSCQVLILDEPTAALSGPQVELLFHHVARLRAGGVAIIYISHRLDEVRRIADRISVLRDGRLVASEPASQLDMARAVRLMVGTGSGEEPTSHRRQIGSRGASSRAAVPRRPGTGCELRAAARRGAGNSRPRWLGTYRIAARDLRRGSSRLGRGFSRRLGSAAPVQEPAPGGSTRESAWFPKIARRRGSCSRCRFERT